MFRPKYRRPTAILALIACLLFQQVAMAAYACTMTQMPTAPGTMAQDCAAMASELAQRSDPVCQKHCTPDPTTASTQGAPSVPALALPPVLYELTLFEGRDQSAFASDVVFARSDPPPRVRYCRLLI